ncbi:MAG: 3-dehydroquinate synthase [Anaerolineales bacterium]|jgi:3-dehydroquinate synthase|nr:3-dehydroquinate synthase [Anaerolineales bacterium]
MPNADLPTVPDYLFLYGPPGVGKSSVALRLSQSLKLPCIQLDTEIEKQAGCSIRDIFSISGEAVFRKLEKQVLQETLQGPRAVIALGGGALLDPENRQLVEAAGAVVCLTAPLTTLIERIKAQPRRRPLLGLPDEPDEQLRAHLTELMQQRQAHYDSFPLQVSTSLRTAEVVSWEIQVQLGCFHIYSMPGRNEKGYAICARTGSLRDLGAHLHRLKVHDPVAVVADETVARLYGDQVLEALSEAHCGAHLVTFPPGEASKTLDTISYLWQDFLSHRMERSSTVVALGGGVTTDLAGFAASTYLRGIHWIAVPTTLLGMADAAIGGKTGFDLPQGKNLVGSFYPPRLVLADLNTLKTLPEEELRAGLAEAVKSGLIGDEELFNLCCQGWEMAAQNIDKIVRRSMAVKIRLVQADPDERSQRAALNLGHTIGHAVEKASAYRLRHGEAVAIGLVVEARLAEQIKVARRGLADRIAACLGGLGLPTQIPAYVSPEAVVQAVGVDKKRSEGSPRFALPLRPGRVQVGIGVPNWEQIVFSQVEKPKQ